MHKLITPQDDSAVRLRKLVVLLPVHDKRTFILSLLRVISTRHLQSDAFEDGDETWWKHDEAKVAGAAALLEKIVLHDDDYRSLVLEWLTSSSGGGIGEPIALRRAIMAVLAHEGLAFRGLFEKLLQQFADKLWIKHTPIMRQEGPSRSSTHPFFFFCFPSPPVYIQKLHCLPTVNAWTRSSLLVSERPDPPTVRRYRAPELPLTPRPPGPIIKLPQRRLEPHCVLIASL